ncbi:UDP-N-acetylmuramoyl-L-alanine--D-glutamate ligase [Thermoflavifilum thermophilum]|uniref:UDP-N-acetylmuramoylalanine--D-glutamate ligase n=1 Tax=Thermoflavifilum thermophilum TaxID=1393122 RepID=A0A1I7N4G6_9BACT|nr:UDP-N-acetylmuramoyl-L-alanine--D-glutamate ligase [Thermoflavifilum thermophilum]SFV29493.1 UDP-N-acetylmuramoylalanine--D-glutamate ligase [Thermoflavifilum thermophilum]
MAEKVVILGAGESGVGAALLAVKQGYEVWVSDAGAIADHYRQELQAAHIPFEEHKHSYDKIFEADWIIKSPGIAEAAPVMQAVRSKSKRVISEIEWAYRFCNQATIIAITGTNGKTTTTALIHYLLKNSGIQAACVGNIGNSFARQVATSPEPCYVVEVSSFQLDDIETFHPHVAVLLNITEDHLDRYGSMEAYAAAKFRITENQTAEDYFIYCLDDPYTRKFFKKNIHSQLLPFSIMEQVKQGAYMQDQQIHIRIHDDECILSADELSLRGKHNIYNSMAAGIAGKTMNIRNEKIRESLATFKGIEHRLEYVATVRGVEFINDSKATNVNSVWYALECMKKPVILIMGGIDKGNDYEIIRGLVKEKVKAIVCLGKDNRKINEAFKDDVQLMVNTTSMKEAVEAAFHFASPGDVVLLSPGCASFDLFKNYEDRGRQFKQAVKDL